MWAAPTAPPPPSDEFISNHQDVIIVAEPALPYYALRPDPTPVGDAPLLAPLLHRSDEYEDETDHGDAFSLGEPPQARCKRVCALLPLIPWLLLLVLGAPALVFGVKYGFIDASGGNNEVIGLILCVLGVTAILISACCGPYFRTSGHAARVDLIHLLCNRRSSRV